MDIDCNNNIIIATELGKESKKMSRDLIVDKYPWSLKTVAATI